MKYKFLLSLLISQTLFASTQLVVLGSGNPNPNPERSGSAYAVIVEDTPYLVDFGPGVIRRIAALSPNWGGSIDGMNVINLEHAFLTHIHSDHTAGLSDLLLTPWVMGRENKLNLFGPAGLEGMALSLLDAYKDDIDYRMNGSQPSNGTGYKFNFTELDNGIVFKDDNLTVEAFKVNHGEFEDAYGFRFTSKDKVIVFSGDILVHEVYSYAGFLKKTKDWQIYHKSHHTSTYEVGEIASRAKPKLLVLSHILFWGADEQDILEETRTTFSGNIKIAEDLMVIK
jgi:ribonuclease BN (tRNA processing enzyme)